MKRICVFCGSSSGKAPRYARAAEEPGRLRAGRGAGLVYGGGKVGLMGTVADAALAGGGEVIGVIPEAMRTRELAHEGLSELHVVDSMLDRKQMMADLSDGFLTLPGGLGTLDELFEVLTWTQLGIHAKPCGLLNLEGYYDKLLAMLEDCEREGFLRPKHRHLLLVENSLEPLLERLLGNSGAPE